MVRGGVIIVITLLSYGPWRCYFFFITLLHYCLSLHCCAIMAVSSLLLCCYAIVRGGAFFSLLRCYTITVLAKILLYLL